MTATSGRRLLLCTLCAVIQACAEGNPENSFACGIEGMAGATMVLEQFRQPGKIFTELPAELDGIVPARVVGYGSARALAAVGPEGAVLGFEGEGFPSAPGFGLILVEDSLDTFKGVLVMEPEPPPGLEPIGTISNATTTLPLFGLRVTWSRVSSERCPLFAPLDTASGPLDTVSG